MSVEICNIALSRYLGAEEIVSLDEDSKNAEQCNLHYEPCRKALLEFHWWNFAKGRRALAEKTNDRPDAWAYAYEYPGNALSLHWVNNDQSARLALSEGVSPDIDRETVSDTIYCDLPQAICSYTKDETDPAVFPQFFKDALSAYLARAICMPITQDRVRLQMADQSSRDLIDLAVALDERNSPQIKEGAPEYLRVRGVV